MKKTFEFSLLSLLVVMFFSTAVVAVGKEVKYGPGENIVLSRLNALFKDDKKGKVAAESIVTQYKALSDTSKELHQHVVPTRDPATSSDQHHHLKKKVVEQLRSKLDTSVLKTAHGMAQMGPLRSLIEKTLDAKIAWAKEEGTQLKKFLALNAKTFENSLEDYFNNLSTIELYRLVCEIKALLEVLHDAMPDGKTLLGGLKAQMMQDQAIIAAHSHPAPVHAEVIE